MNIYNSDITQKKYYDYEVSEIHSKEELNYERLAEIIKNNSIDYEKLSEAIINAKENSDKKDHEEAKATYSLLQFTSSLFLIIFLICFIIITIGLFYGMYSQWSASTIYIKLFWICLLLLSLMLTIIVGKSAYEINKTNNPNLVNTVFTALMAFTAILIAVIQLFQGGGCNCGK